METAENIQGVLLINLGSPEKPRPREVRAYLRQFLSDPRVLDMNPLGRALLLNLIILPFRPRRSARAYAEIWTPEGSPLILYTRSLALRVQEFLDGEAPDRFSVKIAMRYGEPSLAGALQEFQEEGVKRLIAAPLYPQYASSTSGSTMEELHRLANGLSSPPLISSVGAFYDRPEYAEALCVQTREFLKSLEGPAPEYFLFSFHGLPESHIRKSDGTGHCLSREDCCEAPGEALPRCYRAQSYATARTVAEALALPEGTWGVSFQSRLGRVPWIRPYTDETARELAERGVKNLAVIAPSFISDCLETLEELNIQLRADFLRAGGRSFHYIPCLNDSPVWARGLGRILLEQTA